MNFLRLVIYTPLLLLGLAGGPLGVLLAFLVICFLESGG